ncbi:hypothetical protein CYMTET_10703 [Cymbomonas tetramitiformis]|uniref:Uncharacterized protein n=1 Tax=Cymbomonas tetramitiformis TaxID=36881 RepID=A0AAE0LE67_9CHLO|nr:hypothetical protein CYMTET_10703 [Cymbomonas tetramitiformis]
MSLETSTVGQKPATIGYSLPSLSSAKDRNTNVSTKTPYGRVSATGEIWWPTVKLNSSVDSSLHGPIVPLKNVSMDTREPAQGTGQPLKGSWGKQYSVTTGWGTNYSFLDARSAPCLHMEQPTEIGKVEFSMKRVAHATEPLFPPVRRSNGQRQNIVGDPSRGQSLKGAETESKIRALFMDALFAGRAEISGSSPGRGLPTGSALQARCLRLRREHRAPVKSRRLGSPIRAVPTGFALPREV